MSQALIDEVRSLEDRRYKAMIGRDFDALRSLLHPELVYTHSNAAVDSRDSWIAGIEARRFDYRGVERFDELIRVYGDTAIVSGRIRIELVSGGTPRQLNSRFVNVWVRQGGTWQMTLWQSTPIPA
jgi:hypothetical protein